MKCIPLYLPPTYHDTCWPYLTLCISLFCSKNIVCFMVIFSIPMVTTLWSCTASHPQLYLIGYTSWVIACYNKGHCAWQRQRETGVDLCVCVEGKVADIVEVKNKHHHNDLLLWCPVSQLHHWKSQSAGFHLMASCSLSETQRESVFSMQGCSKSIEKTDARWVQDIICFIIK